VTACASVALHFVTELPLPVIEAILSRQPAQDVRIAMDGAIDAVRLSTAERVLKLLGFDTVMANGGMSVAERCRHKLGIARRQIHFQF
jgi:hypothetical protein